MVRLQLIGGGRMGEAMLAGVLDSGWATPGDVRVVELSETRRDELATRFDGIELATDPGRADGTVIAVKPQHVDDAVRAAVAAGSTRLLSIAAGIPIARLEAAAGAGVRVV